MAYGSLFGFFCPQGRFPLLKSVRICDMLKMTPCGANPSQEGKISMKKNAKLALKIIIPVLVAAAAVLLAGGI